MLSASNFTSPFATVILGVTKPELLIKPPVKKLRADQPHASTLLEESTDALITELAVAKKTYGVDILSLTVICRCIEGIMANSAVMRYISQHHADAGGELSRLAAEVNLERLAGPS